MHSSTSNSDQRIPHPPLLGILASALALFLGFAALLEFLLAVHGVRPTVVDSEARWQQERRRADDVGSRALILVGASRMQIDADLVEMRRVTGLEPVQLAIGGGNWVPVLKGLAADPKIRGTILVDWSEKFVSILDPDHISYHDDGVIFERDYEREGGAAVPRAVIEGWLEDRLHLVLRSYADDATPWQSLLNRAFVPAPSPQYMTVRPDRSRLVDFSLAPMKDYDLPKGLLNGDKVIPLSMHASRDARIAELREAIAALHPEDNTDFRSVTAALAESVEAIRKRGGKVIFIRMPVSGWIRQADEKRFPRSLFWDVFARDVGAPSVNFADIESLQRFNCPDGVHLDRRDRTRFTNALVTELGLAQR